MSVTHVYMTYYPKLDPFGQKWPILPRMTHSSKCNIFYECDPCLESVTHSPKFNLFGQMWPILHTVTDTSKGDNFDECHPCL